MQREGSGEQSKADKLTSFYVRQNTPVIQEMARRYEADFGYIGEQIAARIESIEKGTYSPTYKDRLDLLEVISPNSKFTYRLILRYTNGVWHLDEDSTLGGYFNFFARLDSLYGSDETDQIAAKAFVRQNHLHKLFYKLSLVNPAIGITSLLFYDYVKTNNRPCIKWYENILQHSESIISQLGAMRDGIADQTRHAHTLNFIDDVINEFELLISDIAHIAFQAAFRQDHAEIQRYDLLEFDGDGGLSYAGTFQGRALSTRKPGIITGHVYFEESKKHIQKLYATELAHFYAKHKEYFGGYDLGPHSIEELTQKGAEGGVIMVPFYIESRDLSKFIVFLSDFITNTCSALRGEAQRMTYSGNEYERGFRNGVSMIFRGLKNTMTDKDAPTAQARISFKYKGVKIRLDKDEERGKVMLDYGEVDFRQALTMVDMLLSEYLTSDRQHAPSLIDTRLVHLRTMAGSDQKKLSEVQEIEMNAKVALIASIVMLHGFGSMPMRQNLHSSYHSSEYVSGKQYYDHFADIANELDRIVTKKR